MLVFPGYQVTSTVLAMNEDLKGCECLSTYHVRMMQCKHSLRASLNSLCLRRSFPRFS